MASFHHSLIQRIVILLLSCNKIYCTALHCTVLYCTFLGKYMLRREKRDVELTLPKKTETIIEVELTLTQKRWYRAVFERNRNFLMQGPSKKIPSLINVLMQLRKVCNHPFLVAGSREAVYEDHYAAETAALTTVASMAANEDTSVDTNTNVNVKVNGSSVDFNTKFSSSLTATTSEPAPTSDDIQKTNIGEEMVIKDEGIKSVMSDNKMPSVVDCSTQQNLDPALKDPLVYCSGKIVFLHKLLIKLKRENSKSLIFSQFTTTLDVIQEYLTAYGYGYEVHLYVPSVC